MPNTKILDYQKETYKNQKTLQDKLWFLYEYGLSKKLTIDKEKYDYSDKKGKEFTLPKEEVDFQNEITESLRNDLKNKASVDEYKKVFKLFGGMSAKNKILLGQQYFNIVDALPEDDPYKSEKAEMLTLYGNYHTDVHYFERWSDDFKKNIRNDFCDLLKKDNTIDLDTLTYSQMFDYFGYPDASEFFEKSRKSRHDVIYDDIEGHGNLTKEEKIQKVCEYIFNTISDAYQKNAEKQYIDDLRSPNHEQDFNKAEEIYQTYKNDPKSNPDIVEWEMMTGNDISQVLKNVNENRRLNTALMNTCRKSERGLDEGTLSIKEECKEQNASIQYIKTAVKHEGKFKENIIINETEKDKKKFNEANVRNHPDKQEKTFENYMLIHTGTENNKDAQVNRQNLSKVMAAFTLEKLEKPFSVDNIHKTSKHIDKLYQLDDLSDEEIKNALKNKESVLRLGESRRQQLYAIKGDRYNDFVNDMNTLKENMMSPTTINSSEYKALYKAVKKAANLNNTTAGMNDEQKSSAFINANIELINAIENYTKGKEKVRTTNNGNERINNSLDALSIVSKYTTAPDAPDAVNQLNPKCQKIIEGINAKRNNKKIALDDFTNNYGATRSVNAKKARERQAQAPNL